MGKLGFTKDGKGGSYKDSEDDIYQWAPVRAIVFRPKIVRKAVRFLGFDPNPIPKAERDTSLANVEK